MRQQGFTLKWRAIFPDADVSSKWASEQFIAADTAVTAIGDVEQARTEASHAYEMVSQQLENCENNIANEKKSLRETEEQLQNASDTLEDLKADIESIKTGFWELLPEAFHGVAPRMAVNQFENKIEEVEARKGERDTAETQLQVLNTNIEGHQSNLEDLRDRHKKLETEIDGYRREGGGVFGCCSRENWWTGNRRRD